MRNCVPPFKRMIWYYIPNSNIRQGCVKVPYESIHEDDWLRGCYAMRDRNIMIFFETYDEFENWRIAAERRAVWSIGN